MRSHHLTTSRDSSSIDRRAVLAGGIGLALSCLRTASANPSSLRDIAREAWIYALPLIEFGRARQRARTGSPLNTIAHVPALADHMSRTVTTPNADTLYSSARIELSAGPVRLVVPAGRERYLSLALMDAYTNNFAILGTRTTPDGGTFRLVGPGSPRAAQAIRSPTNQVWALGRTLVASADDLDAARAAARGIQVTGPAVPPPIEVADRDASWRDYFHSADQLMRLNPPPASDAPFLRSIARLGMGTGFDPGRFSAAEASEIELGIAQAREEVRNALGHDAFVSGWSYPKPGRGAFGQDYLQRAAVALGGLATLPREEAMYMRAVGDGGGLFRGGKQWRLRFDANRLPPVKGFWSLTLYEATSGGQFFLFDNPLRRYLLGDRTPGLRRNADGSLDLWIGERDPGAPRHSNWLPAPGDRPYALVLRTYIPDASLLSGEYRLPPLVPSAR